MLEASTFSSSTLLRMCLAAASLRIYGFCVYTTNVNICEMFLEMRFRCCGRRKGVKRKLWWVKWLRRNFTSKNIDIYCLRRRLESSFFRLPKVVNIRRIHGIKSLYRWHRKVLLSLGIVVGQIKRVNLHVYSCKSKSVYRFPFNKEIYNNLRVLLKYM